MNGARYHLKHKLLIICLALSLAPLSISGQQAEKRPLTHGDYDTWRSIQLQQLSRDGKFAAYALVPEDADGEVVVRNLASGTDWRYPRGHRPDLQLSPSPTVRWTPRRPSLKTSWSVSGRT